MKHKDSQHTSVTNAAHDTGCSFEQPRDRRRREHRSFPESSRAERHGIIESWNHGIIELLNHGIIKLLNHIKQKNSEKVFEFFESRQGGSPPDDGSSRLFMQPGSNG
jgi:hypothetical protein